MHEELKSFAEHLTFLGYELTEDKGNIVRFKHRTNFNIRLQRFRGGILFSIVLPIAKESVAKEPVGYYKAINILNDAASVARYYDDGNAKLYLEAWHPITYNRLEFPQFMNNWQADLDRTIEKEYFDRLRPFIPTT